MATVIDFGLLETFDFIFPVLFVFAVVYALLHKTKAVGDSISIKSIVAVTVAFTMLLSKTAIDIINFIIPWFTVAIIFLVLLLLIFMMFGTDEELLKKALLKDMALTWTFIGVGLVIIIAAFSSVLGQELVERGGHVDAGPAAIDGTHDVSTDDFEKNLFNTLFHPKVLGIVVLFTIGIFAIALLTGAP